MNKLSNYRKLVFIIGLFIIVLAIIVLIYAFWPVQVISIQSTLPPAIFTPLP